MESTCSPEKGGFLVINGSPLQATMTYFKEEADAEHHCREMAKGQNQTAYVVSVVFAVQVQK